MPNKGVHLTAGSRLQVTLGVRPRTVRMRMMRIMNRRRGFVLGITILVMAAIPGYIRTFVIVGD